MLRHRDIDSPSPTTSLRTILKETLFFRYSLSSLIEHIVSTTDEIMRRRREKDKEAQYTQVRDFGIYTQFPQDYIYH